MASVGERLRVLRESRNTTIDEMVTATGIGQAYLDALERDAIHDLPGKAFGKLYIRAYAEVFAFDPRPWIDDYDREQRLVAGTETEPTASAPAGTRPVAAAIAQWKAARAAEKPEPVLPEETTETEPPPELDVEMVAAGPEVSTPRPPRRLAPLVVVGVAGIVAALYFFTRSEPPAVPPAPAPVSPEPPPSVAAVVTELEPPPKATAPKATAPIVRGKPAGALTVTESGVGRRVVNLQLEGESDRFDQGARVCFATRVTGGERGAVVRHVWLYEGRVEQTITLKLGGSDWRTHSTKTLGRAGAWAVEARDGRGAVVARVEFHCGP